jgi:galactokinase
MICDTRAERALTGSEYPERRAQCEEGARILSGFCPHIKSLRDATLEQLTAHQADLDPVVYRARGAGAGFGGCLVAFVQDDKINEFAQQVLAKYEIATGIDSQVYPVVAADGAGVLDIEVMS